MYAIINAGGRQYKVKPEEFVEMNRVAGDVGNKITFESVAAVGEEGGQLNVGSPAVTGAVVEAEIVEHFRGKKLIAFKMKRRKGYRHTVGHRQELTKVKITAINA
ncbi:MAG: 50S ribosomal protein L21 [Victivallaceae bacterium]|jgi:large subunit ribosomal protein L21|nr:50S ribosomal protein L21 [Victivallaceae bacterium]MDD4317605.1 50S ribosomal protein L21 [Victivallaceae bacterium]MDD5662983.1 50S ribosomal protein L21 [Victivallaceae bacterium]NLK84133.1 50S ribosomal protein L21 [Lentisphaerota bacterium]